MNVLAQTGQVEAHEAQVTLPVTPSVTGQPESRPEWKQDWFSKGAGTFQSPAKPHGGLENPRSGVGDWQSGERDSG
jgi:hypothetical protein